MKPRTKKLLEGLTAGAIVIGGLALMVRGFGQMWFGWHSDGESLLPLMGGIVTPLLLVFGIVIAIRNATPGKGENA